MQESTLLALESLKEALDNSPLIKMCNQREKEMESDPAFSILMQKKKEAEETFILANKTKQGLEEARQRLKEVAKQLDALPSVVLYEEAYKKVESLYKKIDKILLSPYRL